MTIGWTLCSGIGAPEMAAPAVDWRLAAEIEPFPRAVLQHRFGYVPPADQVHGGQLLWDDMAALDLDFVQARGVPLPDLLVAGTPCQSFSVAGLRKGLSDSRGNLTLKFVEICHAIVAARPDGKLAVLWENVPGVLSDSGNAFGAFLGGLVGAVDALPCPADGRWPGEGMVQGPRARAAWAVLNAQYFGVAQRRRCVFVVVDFGGACDPAAVLLEPESVRGNPPSRREAGEGIAADVAPSLVGSGRGVERIGETRGQDPVVAVPDVAWALQERDAKGADSDTKEGHLIPVVTHALRGEGFDGSEDGTGRGTPLVPVAFDCMGTEVQHDSSGVSPPLRSMGHNDSHQNTGGHAAVAFQDRFRGNDGRGYGRAPSGHVEQTGALDTVKPWHVACAWSVRRLTPTEAARLQGFPDDHTAITYRGKPAADGPQYKAYGNSMAVPCVRWILERMI